MGARRHLTFENTLWILVLLVAVADVISTFIGLSNGLVEQNPIGDYIIENIGFIGLMVMKLLIIGFCYILSQKLMPGNWTRLPPVLLFIVWGAATLVNITLIVIVSFNINF